MPYGYVFKSKNVKKQVKYTRNLKKTKFAKKNAENICEGPRFSLHLPL